MFGLGIAETVAVAGFALSTLGVLVRLSIQCGKILQRMTAIEHRLHDHETRLRRVEGRGAIIPPYGVPHG